MSNPCSKERVKLNMAKKNVNFIRKVQQDRLAEAEKIISGMVKDKRPAAMISLSRKLVKSFSSDEVEQYNQEAAAYWMPPNSYGEMVTLFNLARARANAASTYLDACQYEKKCQKALDECRKKAASKRCGKMTTKNTKCLIRLGPDGVCQYHG